MWGLKKKSDISAEGHSRSEENNMTFPLKVLQGLKKKLDISGDNHAGFKKDT